MCTYGHPRRQCAVRPREEEENVASMTCAAARAFRQHAPAPGAASASGLILQSNFDLLGVCSLGGQETRTEYRFTGLVTATDACMSINVIATYHAPLEVLLQRQKP